MVVAGFIPAIKLGRILLLAFCNSHLTHGCRFKSYAEINPAPGTYLLQVCSKYRNVMKLSKQERYFYIPPLDHGWEISIGVADVTMFVQSSRIFIQYLYRPRKLFSH